MTVTKEMIEAAKAETAEEVLRLLTAHELYQYRPKAFQGFIDYVRKHFATAALSSRSAEAGKPVVKGLEWVPSAFDTQYGLIIRIAKTPFGPYKILKGTQGRYEVYFGNAPYSGSMDDEDQAKAWAYSDYEDRILRALSTPADIELLDGMRNIEIIAKVISLSYGENPEDDAETGKICGPNNEPLPNWMAYEEQAKAVIEHLKVADREPVSVPDDPMLDGTDGAHPAWWRGCDHGYSKGLVAAAKIAEKLFTAEFTPQEPGFLRGVGYAAQMIFDEINDAAAAPQPNPSKVDAKLVEALTAAEPYVEICHSLMTHKEIRSNVWRVLKQVRAALAAQGDQP